MSYNVDLYTFVKKVNSTKQPSGTGSEAPTNVKVDLKSGTTIENPIFTITTYKFSEICNFNYLKFQGSYYYINDIKSINYATVEITASIDVLASHRSDIGNYEGFIKRTSNNAQYSEVLPDNILTPYGLNGSSVETWSTGFDYSQNYCSLASYGSNGAEYNMIKDTPENITGALMGNVTDLWSAVYQKLTTPAEYIKSMKLFPLYPNSLSIGTLVKLGNATSVNFATGRPLLASDRNYEKSFSLPLSTFKSDMLYAQDDYRRYDPDFTILGMTLPFVGYISLDNIILNYLYINITYTIDFYTGNGQVIVFASNNDIGENESATSNGGKEIYFGNVQIGVNIPLVTFYDNKSNLQNAIADVIGNPLKTVDKAISRGINPTRNITQIGNIDGMSVNDIGHIRLMAFYRDSKTRTGYKNIKGYPSEEYGSPSLNHYYEFYNPSIPIQGKSGDTEKINSYLESGFYYE